MTLRPKGIVFDADNVPVLADFWHRATGYETKSSNAWFALLIPEGVGLKHMSVYILPDLNNPERDTIGIFVQR